VCPFVLFLVVMGGGVASGPGTGRLTRLLQGEDIVSLRLPTVPDERPLAYLRPSGPEAIVRFATDVTAARQAAIERQYALRLARPIDEGAARMYVLTDHSPETLRRLKADPGVADVTNVDDQGHVLRDPPWSVLRRWLHIPVFESPLLNKMNGAIWLYDALFFTPFVAAAVLVVRAMRRRNAEGESGEGARRNRLERAVQRVPDPRQPRFASCRRDRPGCAAVGVAAARTMARTVRASYSHNRYCANGGIGRGPAFDLDGR
jgi:hypothetical protein